MRSHLAFFVLLLLPMSALCQDTPVFRANLDHTGLYSAAGVAMFTGVEWKFQTNGRVISSPAVENAVVYVGSAVWNGPVYFGCRDSNVDAVDAKTGKQKWFYSTKGSWVNNSAAVCDGKVFFGTSIPGLLPAVDAKTGAEMFSRDTKFPVFASIAIADGMLYFGTLDGKLAAVDLKTQKQLGSFRTTRPSRSCPQSRIPMGS